eukprot:CAMPEP_0172468216 /NCGR_PEP_ID=MMETSP1065-20121228/60860_1 /TAXON_ID=265537 /ORGANISM="Amphiprora paludosa, Strain CCMP125" /LENGTH=220 /DNA_ID=CAMNT_0013225569 /DNA_START=263 /DNA_END=925 /DNA_ORIENTATION=+
MTIGWTIGKSIPHASSRTPAFLALSLSSSSEELNGNEKEPDFEELPTLPDETAQSIQEFSATSKISQEEGAVTELPPIAADDLPSIPDLNQAPPVSFEKYLTMQDKRVVVTIRYSGDAGLKPYFLTVAKKLKASHPDVMIERRILADVDDDDEDEATFEVLVDSKIVIGRGIGRGKKQSLSKAEPTVVFVSMQELDIAISRARRRRRPTTTYGMGDVVST